jgi:hypothetical protein
MKHIHLGHSRSAPKHLLIHLAHAQKPFHLLHHGGAMYSSRTLMSGKGYAGQHKKDVGSMSPISLGQGVHKHHKKLMPLKFKM